MPPNWSACASNPPTWHLLQYSVPPNWSSWHLLQYISYLIVSYRIVSYCIVSYRIVSYRIVSTEEFPVVQIHTGEKGELSDMKSLDAWHELHFYSEYYQVLNGNCKKFLDIRHTVVLEYWSTSYRRSLVRWHPNCTSITGYEILRSTWDIRKSCLKISGRCRCRTN